MNHFCQPSQQTQTEQPPAPDGTNPQSSKRPAISRGESSKHAPRFTRRILIQQEALRLFVARAPEARRKPASELDIVDAALLDHVAQRLTVRRFQKVKLHANTAVVWTDFRTIAAENWLLRLGQDAISRRFSKLVRAGLLVRLKVPLGSKGGSRTYFGLSQAWRTALEDQETVQGTPEERRRNAGGTPAKADTDEKRLHSEAAFEPCRYGADETRLL